MKTKIITAISALLICATAVSCGKSTETSSSSVSDALDKVEVNSTTEISVSAESTMITTTFSETTDAATTASVIADDRQLAESYYKKQMGDYDASSEPYIQEDIDHLVDSTDLLSEKVLGQITSEEDAIQKGRNVLIEIKGQEYIDEHESDYITQNDEQVKLIRDNPPYITKYDDEYDIWQVISVLRTGKTEAGNRVITPGTSPYVLIRGCDGKVVGIYH